MDLVEQVHSFGPSSIYSFEPIYYLVIFNNDKTSNIIVKTIVSVD